MNCLFTTRFTRLNAKILLNNCEVGYSIEPDNVWSTDVF